MHYQSCLTPTTYLTTRNEVSFVVRLPPSSSSAHPFWWPEQSNLQNRSPVTKPVRNPPRPPRRKHRRSTRPTPLHPPFRIQTRSPTRLARSSRESDSASARFLIPNKAGCLCASSSRRK